MMTMMVTFDDDLDDENARFWLFTLNVVDIIFYICILYTMWKLNEMIWLVNMMKEGKRGSWNPFRWNACGLDMKIMSLKKNERNFIGSKKKKKLNGNVEMLPLAIRSMENCDAHKKPNLTTNTGIPKSCVFVAVC